MKDLFPGTCVAPLGQFVYGIHKPRFKATNLRENDYVVALGRTSNQEIISNADNFPDKDVQVTAGAWIFEIPNAFPFMGATFILKAKADQTVDGCNPFHELSERKDEGRRKFNRETESRADLLSLASSSTDPELLAYLAERSCDFVFDQSTNIVSGRMYREHGTGRLSPVILDHHLFQLVSNNPSLPDAYKSIKNGELTATVKQDNKKMAETTMRALVGQIKGQETVKKLLIDGFVIDASNVDQYM